MQSGVNFRDLGSAANLLRKGAVYRCSQIFRSALACVCRTVMNATWSVTSADHELRSGQLCGAAAHAHTGALRVHEPGSCPASQRPRVFKLVTVIFSLRVERLSVVPGAHRCNEAWASACSRRCATYAAACARRGRQSWICACWGRSARRRPQQRLSASAATRTAFSPWTCCWCGGLALRASMARTTSPCTGPPSNRGWRSPGARKSCSCPPACTSARVRAAPAPPEAADNLQLEPGGLSCCVVCCVVCCVWHSRQLSQAACPGRKRRPRPRRRAAARARASSNAATMCRSLCTTARLSAPAPMT